MLHDLKPAKSYLILGFLLSIPVTILGVIQPVIIGYAVQHAMLHGADVSIFRLSMVFFANGIAVSWRGIVSWAHGAKIGFNFSSKSSTKSF